MRAGVYVDFLRDQEEDGRGSSTLSTTDSVSEGHAAVLVAHAA